MPCHVPEQYRHVRWHIIRPTACGQHMTFECAEWVNNEDNGPTEHGHWKRWGYCGDFPSLCKAEYLGPLPNRI